VKLINLLDRRHHADALSLTTVYPASLNLGQYTFSSSVRNRRHFSVPLRQSEQEFLHIRISC